MEVLNVSNTSNASNTSNKPENQSNKGQKPTAHVSPHAVPVNELDAFLDEPTSDSTRVAIPNTTPDGIDFAAMVQASAEMNDMEVVVQVIRGGKEQYELGCFIAHAFVGLNGAIVIGGESAAKKMIEEGKIKVDDYTPSSPDGYVEPSES